MALDKQVHIYCVDTSAFYNYVEDREHNNLLILYSLKNKIIKRLNKKNIDAETKKALNQILFRIDRIKKKKKNKLHNLINNHKGIRYLNPDKLKEKNIIAMFESNLTRVLNLKTNSLSTDLFVVKTYFFKVLEDIILNGFIYNGEKYICLTASAGQIRTKKTVFIREKLWLKHKDTLMCGLTVEDINNKGGVNINKYLAYLALCNSATDLWEGFDIDKSIVVEDMETVVNGLVDFIDDKTYKIQRKTMDVPINHTDGCGMILPRKSRKNIMVRLPWIKGLLSPFPFDVFIKEHNCSPVVVDIYGKKHDILKEDIEVIFTKSQFKMWKYYDSWQQYKDNYKKYNCQAGKCNEEEDYIDNAKLNYQMLQTLTDITDKELQSICKETIQNITNVGNNRKTMLKILGVTKGNTHKNYFQQAIEIYPELLSDKYSKEILRQVKKKIVKEARAAKLDVNAKYTFIIPDLYAFCEYLFLGQKNPKGLLKNGEVYCKLYKNNKKLDCLRPPHLHREHAVRNNVVDDEKSKWFTTKGLYTSCHDLISKILQFDVDGDKSLVVADDLFVEIAERNMKDIVPLYYQMAKAGAEKITNESIYNGLTTAYSGGNIGVISNNITKIWNSDNVNLDVIKLLCMENNFVIDYAKTLYKPKRPKHIKQLISNYTKYKVPHFFIYAKDKNKHQVEKINDSVVNKLEKIISNPPIRFKNIGLNNFDYKMLMHNSNVDIDVDTAQQIIKLYTEQDLKKRVIEIVSVDEDNTTDKIPYYYLKIRNEILSKVGDIKYVVDVLVKYLYKYKKSDYKTTLWSSFGDIILDNLKKNIKKKISEGYIQCSECNKLIKPTNNRQKYCKECWKEKQKILWKKASQKYRNKNRHSLEKSQNPHE